MCMKIKVIVKMCKGKNKRRPGVLKTVAGGGGGGLVWSGGGVARFGVVGNVEYRGCKPRIEGIVKYC